MKAFTVLISPQITTTEPKVTTQPAIPSIVHTSGPKKTQGADPLTPIFAQPAHSHAAENPKQTAVDPLLDPSTGESGSPRHHSHHLAATAENAEDPANSQPVSKATQTMHSTAKFQDEADQSEKGHESEPRTKKLGTSSPTTIQLVEAHGLNAEMTTIHLQGLGESHNIINVPNPMTPDAFASFIFAPFARTNHPSGEVSEEISKIEFPVITAAGRVLTITDPSAISIADTVIIPGGPGVRIDGTPVSLLPSGNLIVGTASSSFQPISSVLVIAGHTVTANPTSFDIGSTYVRAGQPGITISGVVLSLEESGNLKVGDINAFTSDNHPFTAPGTSETARPSLLTLGALTITPNPTAIAIGSTTLSAGGPGMTVANTPLSLNPDGSLIIGSLIIGSSTIALQTLSSPFPSPSVLTTDGATITLGPDSEVVIDGATLVPGGQATTLSDGRTVSVGSAGLVIGTDTIALEAALSTATVRTIDGVTVTFEPHSHVALHGTTLSIGGPGVTVEGSVVSVGASGLVVGSSTILLPSDDASGGRSATAVAFTGDSMIMKPKVELICLIIVFVVGVLVLET